MVDGDVEISLREDLIYVRTIRGQDARDDGSVCSAPLPNHTVEDFHFEKKQGRGGIRLLEEPSKRSDYQAVVGITGDGQYAFRISWKLEDREPGGLSLNNAFHSAGSGHGVATVNGAAPQRLSAATVDIDRGGKILVSFRTAGRRPLEFSGSLMAPEGEKLKADVASAGPPDLRGPMYLSRDAKGNIYRITLDATNGQDHMHLEWDRR